MYILHYASTILIITTPQTITQSIDFLPTIDKDIPKGKQEHKVFIPTSSCNGRLEFCTNGGGRPVDSLVN